MDPEIYLIPIFKQTKGLPVLARRTVVAVDVLIVAYPQIPDLRSPVIADAKIDLTLHPRGPGMAVLHVQNRGNDPLIHILGTHQERVVELVTRIPPVIGSELKQRLIAGGNIRGVNVKKLPADKGAFSGVEKRIDVPVKPTM